ncbi:MAG: mannonate dehydratase [Tannerellaceae bacterium]|jgi:mannonate dehydratase|nr:mannonate dehydratase [Tannerellaceae bacterium]
MKKTWRWFGTSDPVTLSMLRQIGVQAIATSLHHIPIGKIWQSEDILSLKQQIESFDLTWEVVESLPVHESIKYNGERAPRMVDYYKQSLANLAKAGIHIVCYNFMPLIEKVRTDFYFPLSHGGHTLRFDPVRFAYFDMHILRRPHAQHNYTQECLTAVEDLAQVITPQEEQQLAGTILVKPKDFVPGNLIKGAPTPVNHFRKLLERYGGIGREQLRRNLINFLQQIIPFAEQHGIKLAIHPDDPPFPLFGLPRIVSSVDDLEYILHAVDNYYNGLTFCAGSLAAGLHNDVEALAYRFADRTHFLHLRSVDIHSDGAFSEASPLDGYPNLVKLTRLFETQRPHIPYHIDYGYHILQDLDPTFYNPGYSFLGRMLAFAQIDGVITTINQLD